MTLTLTHQYYQKTATSPLESRFVLASEDGVIGQMMTERQARTVLKNLGFEFPNESTLRQWTVEIGN
jgi:hypothetical protein